MGKPTGLAKDQRHALDRLIRGAPLREVAALSAAGALANAALDLALPSSLMEMFYIRMC
jgi:hypothetical protein